MRRFDSAFARDRHTTDVGLRIIKSAEHLIRKQGFEKTTVAEISKDAAVSRSTFYSHFSGKNALKELLLGRGMEHSHFDAEDRRKDLLSAAYTVFCERGFMGATMDEIAAAAGVAKATLYIHFDDKEELFKAFIAEYTDLPIFESLFDEGKMQRALKDGRIRDVMLFMAEKIYAISVARSDILPVAMLEISRFPELAAVFKRNLFSKGVGSFKKLIDEGVTAGVLRDQDAVTLFVSFMSFLRISAFLARNVEGGSDGESSPEVMLESFVDLLLNGLLKRDEDNRSEDEGR